MQIRLLGAVELVEDGRSVPVGGPMERRLLALLTTHANTVVSDDRIVHALWGDAQPRTAKKTLQGYVSRLRKAFAGADGFAIETRAPGYLIYVPEDGTDIAEVERLAEQASQARADGDSVAAVRLLEQALGAWRGPALSEFADDSFFQSEAVRLGELRLSMVEDRIDAELACGGRHARLAGELEALCSAHPTRERLWGQRMVALYRAGRQADALATFQALRRYLGEELGLEPSAELKSLEHAILNHDPLLDQPSRRAQGPQRPLPLDTAPRPTEVPTGVVTFLLTDIKGSTALWESDAGAMADALPRHDAILGSAVRTHGGFLLKARGEGDSTFSVFARATHAAAAALEAQLALAQATWPAGAVLGVRMALHTGEAYERDGDYFGPTVNRAARLRSLADAGQTLLSQSTAEVVADHLLPISAKVVALGSYNLSDLSRPERVYELTSVSDVVATDESIEAHQPGLPDGLFAAAASTFVGRDDELKILRQHWLEARAGRGGVVLLSGEAGIGKSRLAGAIAAEAYDSGALILFGRCDEEPVVPYQPFAEALGGYVAACPPTLLRTQLEGIRSTLARLIPRMRSGPDAQDGSVGGDPETERYRLFEAVTTFTAAMSRTWPVLIILDDVQWADKPTVLLLRHLLRSISGRPMLIVITHRDTDLGRSQPFADMLVELQREQPIARIAVGGLDAGDVGALAESTAGKPVTPGLVARLHDQTRGNPFFLIEVLRHLAETGGLRDGLQVSLDFLSEGGIPTGVRDVVGRRLRHLPEDVNEVLALASVVGPEFELDVLEQVAPSSTRSVLEMVEEAVRARILEELPGLPPRFAFSHALIRETLYAHLITARRARIHRETAVVLERLHGDDAEYLDELARHYCEAAYGATDKAVEYSQRAGVRAMELLAYEKAVTHFERGLQAQELTPSAAHLERAELLLALGDAQSCAGDLGGARETFFTAASLARDLGDKGALARSALGVGMLWFYGPTGVPGTTGTVDEERVSLLEEALSGMPLEDTTMRSRLVGALAVAWYYGPDIERRLSLGAEAVAIAERSGDKPTLLDALFVQRVALWGPDFLEERRRIDLKMRNLAEELGQLRRVADACLWMAIDLLETGDVEAADAAMRHHRRITADLRQPTGTWVELAYRGLRALIDGNFGEAEALATEAMSIGQSLDPAVAMSYWVGITLWSWREQGRSAELRSVVDAALGVAEAMPATRAVVAFVAGELGDVDGCRAAFEQLAGEDFLGLPRDFAWLASMAMLAVACAHLKDRERAAMLYRLLAPYSGHNAQLACSVTAGPVDHYLGQLAAVGGDVHAATQHFVQAMSMSRRLGTDPFLANTEYAYGALLLEHGQPTDETNAVRALEHALQIADQLGMRPLAERSRALLSPSLTPE